ncbi:Predicted D-lactate dehydrogenase, Fe-S protein, FAD/FMN-containing [Olavius algarvensis Delta 1 endosymbiont]|nr:Predicted D-lactate dehydrogenase, Fe-S protein, FAD/FMN-containing [Olavius algarvensis Delta 1 endosymbiont]
MSPDPYKTLLERLSSKIPQERLITDPLRTLAYGTDASFYRLVPKLIVKVEDENEILAVIQACRELHIAVTFRAAGTSLSGQALSASVLVVLGTEGWRNYQISADRSEITLGAGILGAEANGYLAPFDKKIGPDPASINSAKIGGIVANNACGMASGITGNSMGTVSGMRIIFSDGTILDTRREDSRRDFMAPKKDMLDRISALSESLRNDPAIVERIRRKYEIKNTTGYSVSALVNFDDPFDIIEHLMIGSEGTLGFISEVTFRTLDEPGRKATSLMLFPDIARACEAVLLLKECRVSAAELMDRVSLRSVEDKAGMPPYIKDLSDSVTALLVETAADDADGLKQQADEISAKFADFPMAREFSFTTVPEEQAALWDIRKGLFPSVCFARKKGTTVIIEDIAVPIDGLRDCLLDLQDLFQQYAYRNTIIWGHVFDGNVHFVLTPDLSDAAEIEKYKSFMDDLATLVVDKYDGSLKAEHGTGRNMAPFVKREWGDRIYGAMQEIKSLFDPDHMLNPGVIINEDPDAHAKHIKPMTPAHDLVDTCTECGFCERNCMSHGFTLSARQRIVIYREMTRLAASGDNPGRLEELKKQYQWYGDQTCATDGLCALTCPVEIDTGKLIKFLRHDQLSGAVRWTADLVAKRMNAVTALARFGLNSINRMHGLLGTGLMKSLTGGLRTLSGDRLPRWTPAMPKGGTASAWHAYGSHQADPVVYFPACINRAMGPARNSQKQSLTRITESLLKKAGYTVLYPADTDKLCCGMPFASKGVTQAAEAKARELGDALLKVSDNGRIPILCDMSPCLHHMRETLDSRLQLFEPIQFTLNFLADRLEFRKVPETVAIHTVCSAKKMGLEDDFKRLAEMCADKVVTPDVICCGFAGDRGFTVPELNEFGLRRLESQLAPDVRVGYSTSRTCEIGLTTHSGIDYQSILYLVGHCTQGK